MKRLILLAIRGYQRYLSFDTGILKYLLLTERTCRFTPRCSEYTYEAVERYGTIKGLYLGLRRVLRCHPGSKVKYDPVPNG